VNKVVRHVIEPAGSIKRITAAVVVDDAIERKNQGGKWVEVRHKRQPDELKLISDLAQAAIGYNSTRGDVISVQNLAFEHADAEDIPPATIVDKARKGLSDFSSEVRYGVLLVLFLLVYFLMIRPVQKRVMSAPLGLTASQEEALLRQHELAPIPDSPAVLAQRSLMLKKQLSEFVRSDPESSVTAVRSWIQEEA
jgi:flagellar M-ring protein FliF